MNISVGISMLYIVLLLVVLYNYVIRPKDIKKTEKLASSNINSSIIQKWSIKIDQWARTHPKLLTLIILVIFVGEVINIIKHYQGKIAV